MNTKSCLFFFLCWSVPSRIERTFHGSLTFWNIHWCVVRQNITVACLTGDSSCPIGVVSDWNIRRQCIRVQMTAFGHPCWLPLLGCSESHKRVLDLLVLVVVLQSPESPSQQALPTHTGQPVNTVNKSTKPQLCIHNDLCFVLPGLTGNIRGNSQVDFVNQGKP